MLTWQLVWIFLLYVALLGAATVGRWLGRYF